jgi:hypothetical protein
MLSIFVYYIISLAWYVLSRSSWNEHHFTMAYWAKNIITDSSGFEILNSFTYSVYIWNTIYFRFPLLIYGRLLSLQHENSSIVLNIVVLSIFLFVLKLSITAWEFLLFGCFSLINLLLQHHWAGSFVVRIKAWKVQLYYWYEGKHEHCSEWSYDVCNCGFVSNLLERGFLLYHIIFKLSYTIDLVV